MSNLLFLIQFLAGGAVGAAIVWLVGRPRLAQLRANLEAALNSERNLASAREQFVLDLRQAHEDLQQEKINSARLESDAKKLPALESDLRELRDRTEQLATDRSAFEAQALRIPILEDDSRKLNDDLIALKTDMARIRENGEQQARNYEEKIAMLTQLRGNIEKDLKSLSADALVANQGTFLQLANEVFDKHKKNADVELESRRKAVEDLVAPLQASLAAYKEQVDLLEKERVQSYSALTNELKNVADTQSAVRAETSKLSNALRAAPKTRGRWGEHTLRNVLELSGLSRYCDFTTEESFERDGEILRPDVVINLPGGRTIVVDAKTSLSAYLDATDSIDDVERDRNLDLHASHIRAHVKQLAAKTYWDQLTTTPDFVVMFIPGDNFYSAAAERDPSLFEDAAAQRVVIVTPATLIALAKAVAFGWRQEKVADNAQRVHALGRELYRRISTMTDHIGRCGDALGKSVKAFNQFIGSLEQSVIPQARRFNELEVEGTGTEISLLEHIETEPRSISKDTN